MLGWSSVSVKSATVAELHCIRSSPRLKGARPPCLEIVPLLLRIRRPAEQQQHDPDYPPPQPQLASEQQENPISRNSPATPYRSQHGNATHHPSTVKMDLLEPRAPRLRTGDLVSKTDFSEPLPVSPGRVENGLNADLEAGQQTRRRLLVTPERTIRNILAAGQMQHADRLLADRRSNTPVSLRLHTRPL